MQIELVEDNGRMIVVFNECNEEAREIIRKLVGDVAASTMQITGLEEPDKKAPLYNTFTHGKYEGMTPDEVIEKDGELGYANMLGGFERMTNRVLRQSVYNTLKLYTENTVKKKYVFEKKAEAAYFLRYYSKILKDEIGQVLQQAGYKDLVAFLDGATENDVIAGAKAVFDALLGKF